MYLNETSWQGLIKLGPLTAGTDGPMHIRNETKFLVGTFSKTFSSYLIIHFSTNS